MIEEYPLPLSSSLVSVRYDSGTSTLDVEFRQGEIYRYFMVPRATLHGLLAAPSAGAFFSQEIRPRYQEQRLS